MKKRSCKMSDEEKNNIEAFIERLEAGDAVGIGPATVRKIKDFAINENYINDDSH